LRKWDENGRHYSKEEQLKSIRTNYPTKRYAFEVYFMGIRVYSKILTRLWPNIPGLANKCVKIYNEHLEGKDISHYEYKTKKQRQRESNQRLEYEAEREMVMSRGSYALSQSRYGSQAGTTRRNNYGSMDRSGNGD
jgi:hypothetical protein